MANTTNTQKNIDKELYYKKLFRIVLWVFLSTLTATIILAYLGFFAPPKGEISDSIIKVIAIFLGANTFFEAFVLGYIGILKGNAVTFKTKHAETSIGRLNSLDPTNN